MAGEIKDECLPTSAGLKGHVLEAVSITRGLFYLPRFPAFHSPGWLVRYIVGPYDKEWLEGVYYDISSGITIGLILIPQGLSYGKLAGLPAINGLYAAIVPSFVYTILGSSMQLAVGNVYSQNKTI